MRLLLDTHVLLWCLEEPPRLAAQARLAIESPENMVLVSAASVWEIAIKRALGKLDAPAHLREAMETTGFEPLAITHAHAEAAGALPRHHDDPFDRMLVAQAQLEGLNLVTRDERLARYEVALMRA